MSDETTNSRTKKATLARLAKGPYKLKSPLERARENPTSKALAIAAKCYDCSGAGADPGVYEEIRNCVVTLCPLWPVRPFQKKA